MAGRSRLRWGDTLDEEDGALPQPSISINGNIKTVTEYYRNDKGEAVRKVTRCKVVSVEKKVYKVRVQLWRRLGAVPAVEILHAVCAGV